jgi:uncharacterized protein YdaT
MAKKREPERVTYHVVASRSGGWNVKRENAQRASATTDTKREAIDRARDLAKAQDLGQVIVHRSDGVIQTEWTYGQDPEKHRG